MLWSLPAALAGTMYLVMMGVILVAATRRSPFGWFILTVEYFYVLGLGAFPLLMSLGAIENTELLGGYEFRNGQVRNATFLHIVLYGLGGIVGYFLLRPSAKALAKQIHRIAEANRIGNYFWFCALSGFSLACTALYVSIVGLDVALLNVTLSRSGDLSGLAGFEQYLFLKRLSMTGLFVMAFVPFIILRNEHVVASFLLVALVTLVIYVQTVARVTFLDMIGTFVVLYFALQRSRSLFFITSALGVTAVLGFVFLYGKNFLAALSIYLFSDGDFELVRHGRTEDIATYFFGHFGHLTFAIDAGIRFFFNSGPLLPRDILLSPFGAIPGPIFEHLNLSSMNFHQLPETAKLSCINASYYDPFAQCFAPAYLPGLAAYVAPFIGALGFGLARFWIFSVIEHCWIGMKTQPDLLWLPTFLFLVCVHLMLAIPSSISFAVFVLGVLLLALIIRRVLAAA